jgi:hypothetical protein
MLTVSALFEIGDADGAGATAFGAGVTGEAPGFAGAVAAAASDAFATPLRSAAAPLVRGVFAGAFARFPPVITNVSACVAIELSPTAAPAGVGAAAPGVVLSTAL